MKNPNGIKHKPLDKQIIVITGASSGIGLVTAMRAAARGARVVMFARNEEALHEAVETIRKDGGQAIAVAGDVSNVDDLSHAVSEAERQFGRVDTWVNNAGVSIYGRILDVPLEDQKRLFETNYWGVVHGSILAARHMWDRGGVIINVGSVLSDRAIPLQGPYAASKHAVKGFTDAFRMELEAEGAPIHVTLIKPASIATPYHEHARNYLETEPRNAPPVYAPELVADAILRAAVHPRRDVFVGGGSKLLSLVGQWAPRWSDRMMERTLFKLQRRDEPALDRPDNLMAPGEDGHVRGSYPEPVLERSAYTALVRRPLFALLGAGLVALAAMTLASPVRRGALRGARRVWGRARPGTRLKRAYAIASHRGGAARGPGHVIE